MITFTEFGHKISDKERVYIINALNDCKHSTSFFYTLNRQYNNMYHFSNPNFNYDPVQFLGEIKIVLNNGNIEVMGGVHTDPFGHTSQMIGQYNEIGELVPALTKDTYIRFKINLADNFKLKALNRESIFHYLVGIPEVVRLPLKKIPISVIRREKKVLKLIDPKLSL